MILGKRQNVTSKLQAKKMGHIKQHFLPHNVYWLMFGTWKAKYRIVTDLHCAMMLACLASTRRTYNPSGDVADDVVDDDVTIPILPGNNILGLSAEQLNSTSTPLNLY